MSYPLGWSLASNTVMRRERWPGNHGVHCVPLVKVGELVSPEQPVMCLEKVDASNVLTDIPRLSLPMAAKQELSIAEGQGERKKYEHILAGLRGKVVEVTARGSVVIESHVAVVAGAIGAGKQVVGPLTIWLPPEMAGEQARPILPGSLLVVPGPLSLSLLRQAVTAEIAGVIASSISTRDFEDFLHLDLIDLLNRVDAEQPLATLPPLTLLLTEGLGTFAMPIHTLDLLRKHQNATALLSGATSLRAKLYPDLLISLPEKEDREEQSFVAPNTALEPGALVRVCSGNHEGAIGELNYLFSRQLLFPSGVRAPAARVRLEDGSQLVAPLPALKRIG